MTKKDQSCFQCGEKGIKMYGYTICDSCKSNMGLFTDETIKRHVASFKKSKDRSSYEEEMKYRLDFIEKDYAKKKIKLLYILDRLKHIL